jgi:hypothetical protein
MQKEFTITSIQGGISPTIYNAPEDSYLASVAIDPDLTINVNSAGQAANVNYRTSGAIVPSSYSKFSSTGIDAPVVNFITTPISETMYAVLSNGKVLTYSNTFGSETLIDTCAGDNADEAVYYNNYLYIFGTGAGKNDVSRLRIGQTAIEDAVWTGATLGSQTALATKASVGGVLNHSAYVLYDSLYFCDYVNGHGVIHKIKTTKVTYDGDTNDGSAYDVLDLPFSAVPVCLEAYGSDLAIGGIKGTSGTTIAQSRSTLYLWDTFSDAPYNFVPLPDPRVTALLNANNILYIFGGNTYAGMRVSAFSGGRQVTPILFLEQSDSPSPHAVEAYGDRIVFGGMTGYPDASVCVWSFGSKDPRIKTSLHNIARSSVASNLDSAYLSVIKCAQQLSGIAPRFILGYVDVTAPGNYGLDKFSTDNFDGVFISKNIEIGSKFVVTELRLPLTTAVATGTAIVPQIIVDDDQESFTLDAINPTNFSGKKNIIYKNPKMNGTVSPSGYHNLKLRLDLAETVPTGVCFPIRIKVDIYEDEPTR